MIRSDLRRHLADYLVMALVLVGLVAIFSVTTQRFFTTDTFLTIANQIPDAIVIAVGMTFVLIVAGIDLSVGSVLAFGSATLGVALVQWKLPLPVAMLACLLVGLSCGAVSGWITVRWTLPSFIVTLAMMEVARGAAYLVTNSRTMYIGSSIEGVSAISAFGVSLPFVFAVALVIAAQFVLTRTAFGRSMVAVGTNEEAGRLSGLNTRRIRLLVFALCGLLASVGAIIQTSRLASADPNMGTGAELQAIAACVIGGTSLMGGRGSVISTFFGVLIIAVLGAGLAQVGAQEPTKRLVTGCVIVAAAVLDHYRHRLGMNAVLS